MSVLYDDRLRPITATIGFIMAPAADVANAYVSWMSPIQEKRSVMLQQHHQFGHLDEIASSLLPLTSVERRRFLFIPTLSKWTAFIDNGFRGSDSFSVLSYLSKALGVRSCVATAIRSKSQLSTKRDEYDALGMEIYEPFDTEFLNYGRTLSLVTDDGKLVFTARGTPFSFEDESVYTSKNLRDRLNMEMLTRYLTNLGIEAFNPSFYNATADCPAILIEKVGPRSPKVVEYNLVQAQKT